MQYYPFSVTAASPGNFGSIDGKGGFVRYDEETSGSANPKLRFTSNKGHDFILKPGQSAKLSTPFERLQFVNKDGSTSLAGTIAIGDGDEVIFDSNVVGSVVASIAQTGVGTPRNEDIASIANAFGMAGEGGPTAAQLSLSAIVNPAANIKRLYVDGVWLWVSVAQLVLFLTGDDVRVAGGNFPWINKATGGAGTGRIKTGAAAGGVIGLGVPAAIQTEEIFMTTINESKFYPFKIPYMLDPGHGLYVQSASVNNTILAASWNGREY